MRHSPVPVPAGRTGVVCAARGSCVGRDNSERSLNFVNQIAQINLFFFLFVALLLKVNLDNDNSASLFSGIVVVMSIVPIALPFGLQAYIRLGGFTGEDAHDVKDAAAEATL